jgi:hypothetical protein
VIKDLQNVYILVTGADAHADVPMTWVGVGISLFVYKLLVIIVVGFNKMENEDNCAHDFFFFFFFFSCCFGSTSLR